LFMAGSIVNIQHMDLATVLEAWLWNRVAYQNLKGHIILPSCVRITSMVARTCWDPARTLVCGCSHRFHPYQHDGMKASGSSLAELR